MAKKSMVERERKRRRLVIKYSLKRNALLQEMKKLSNSKNQSSSRFETRFSLHRKLQKLPRNSSPTRLHNRCLLTGRPKGYFRDFGLSRHMLREMAHSCVLPGITKSSW